MTMTIGQFFELRGNIVKTQQPETKARKLSQSIARALNNLYEDSDNWMKKNVGTECNRDSFLKIAIVQSANPATEFDQRMNNIFKMVNALARKLS